MFIVFNCMTSFAKDMVTDFVCQDDLIPSMKEYIAKIQEQSVRLQSELDECDDILRHTYISK